jgi:hypothetical protein
MLYRTVYALNMQNTRKVFFGRVGQEHYIFVTIMVARKYKISYFKGESE